MRQWRSHPYRTVGHRPPGTRLPCPSAAPRRPPGTRLPCPSAAPRRPPTAGLPHLKLFAGSASALRLWKLRNEFSFQTASRRDIRVVLLRIPIMAQNRTYNSESKEKDGPKLSGCINRLKQLATKSGRITGYAKLPMHANGLGWPTSTSTTGAGTLRRQLTT